MNRDEKAQLVEQLQGRFAESPFLILTGYKGSTVAQMDAVRRACEPMGMHFQVVKNTLARRALEGTDKGDLAEHFSGPVGVLISGEDPVGAAKTFSKLAKDNPHLELKAGFFEGDILDAKGVKAVSELPSKEELQATLLATLLAAPRKVLHMFQAPARDLLYLLKNYEQKLQEQEQG